MSNKLTLTDIQNIIDIHIAESRNFLMVTNKDLAVYICEYLDEEYDITDEDEDFDNEEFYVSMWFDEDGIRFYCESARGYDSYKYVETVNDQFVDYFVFADTGMSDEDVNKYLEGEGTWSWCELSDGDEDKSEFCKCCQCGSEDCEDFNCTCKDLEVEDMTDNEIPCDCPECKSARGEFTEEEELEIGLVEHYAKYIEEIQCTCGSELRNILYSLVQECMSIGYENSKEEMREFLED